jgi:hypothetical protein
MSAIKMTNKIYQEFSPLRETCANNSEDDHWDGLWTAMYNATPVHKGHRSPWIVQLTDQQLQRFMHALETQIEYVLFVQLDQALNDGDRKAANEIHYIARQMKQLMATLEAK